MIRRWQSIVGPAGIAPAGGLATSIAILVVAAMAWANPGHAQTTPSRAGYLNDFGRVVDGSSALEIESIALEVRRMSQGEMVLVTLPSVGREDADAVAGRFVDRWGLWEENDAAPPSFLFLLVLDTGQVRVRTSPTVAGLLESTVRRFLERELRDAFADRQFGRGLVSFARMVREQYREAFGG